MTGGVLGSALARLAGGSLPLRRLAWPVPLRALHDPLAALAAAPLDLTLLVSTTDRALAQAADPAATRRPARQTVGLPAAPQPGTARPMPRVAAEVHAAPNPAGRTRNDPRPGDVGRPDPGSVTGGAPGVTAADSGSPSSGRPSGGHVQRRPHPTATSPDGGLRTVRSDDGHRQPARPGDSGQPLVLPASRPDERPAASSADLRRPERAGAPLGAPPSDHVLSPPNVDMPPFPAAMPPVADTLTADAAEGSGGGALGELVRRFDHRQAEPVPAGHTVSDGRHQPRIHAEPAVATASPPGPEPLDVLEQALEELLRREAERYGLGGGPR